jgi:hypothetical protein
MGDENRLMLANAIIDAKTIFFIQYSWELPKWRSMFMVRAFAHGLPSGFPGWMSAGASSKRYHGFQYGIGRIIESCAPRDKRSCKKIRNSVKGEAIRRPFWPYLELAGDEKPSSPALFSSSG